MVTSIGVVARDAAGGLVNAEQAFDRNMSGRFVRALDCFSVATTIRGEDPHLVRCMIDRYLDQHFRLSSSPRPLPDRPARFGFSRLTRRLLPTNLLGSLFEQLEVEIILRPELLTYRLSVAQDASTPICWFDVYETDTVRFNNWPWLPPLY